MAEVEGSDGNQYSIPDFALEDTQEKMLAVLKKQFKLTDADIKNAEKALRNDNKNSKSQLDAFKKLSGDIKGAMDGKGSLLGSMGTGLKSATGAIGAVSGGLLKLGTVVAGVTTGLAALALSVTKGFGEDLRASGLVETGAAFGQLGSELYELVPQIQAMGMSLDTTLGVIQDFRQTLTVVGTEATKGLVAEFNRLTASGSMYARTLSENVDYLADEIDFRQRLMFMDERNAALTARQTQQVLASQVEAAMLLGKSVKDIADSTKNQILGNKSLQAVLASIKDGEALTSITETLNTFSGIGLSDSLQAALIQTISDEVFLFSEESKQLYNQIGIINTEQSRRLQQEMSDMQAAMQSRDPERIARANVEFEKAVVNFAGSISDIEDQSQLKLFADNGFEYISDFLINQQLATKGMQRFVDGVLVAVSDEARLSAMFDTQIEAIQAAFGSIRTAIRSGFAPALENLTQILGEASEANSPLGKFNLRISEIATKLTNSLQAIVGNNDTKLAQEKKQLAEQNLQKASEIKDDKERATAMNQAKKDLEIANTEYEKAVDGDQSIAHRGLELVGDLIDAFADKLISLVAAFDQADGNILEKLSTVFMDEILRPLSSMLGDMIAKAWADFSFWDLFFGSSDYEIKKGVKERTDNKIQRAMNNAGYDGEGPMSEELQQTIANIKSSEARSIINRSTDKDYDSTKTADMLKEVGIGLKDLSTGQLAQVFKNPDELLKAVTREGGTAEDYNALLTRIKTEIPDLVDKNTSFLADKSYLRTYQQAQTAFENAEVIDPTKTDTGTPPAKPSSAPVMTDPDNAEPTTPTPTSQDGTATQEVKPAVKPDATNQENANKKIEEISLTQNDKLDIVIKELKGIKTGIGGLQNAL